MLDKDNLDLFKSNFKHLYNKALQHLIMIEWKDQIDKDVRIQVPIINEREVHFELMHMMVNKLMETKVMTWEQINELPS